MHCPAWYDSDHNALEVREALMFALIDAGETVLLQDENDRYIFVANLPSIWSSPDPAKGSPSDEEIFGEVIAAQLNKARFELALSGNSVTIELPAGDEEIFQFQLSSTMALNERSFTKISIRNVSVERRREQLLRTLLREVSHRSRNLMAIIQSLSDQTARYSLTKEEFLRKFRGRLYALAQSQDLVTDSDWRGAALAELLKQQLELYLPEFHRLVKFEGEDIFLNPNAALYLGLAFHELVVNTVSHGKNLARQEQITATCRHEGERVHFVWKEPVSSDSDLVTDKDKHKLRFGSVVLEKVVPVALNGTATYEISDLMIVYTLNFSISSLA